MKVLKIKVKPNARAAKLEQAIDGTWVAHVTAPPLDGKANAMLIAMVAKHFGVRKNDVTIKSGAAGRLKRIAVDVKDILRIRIKGVRPCFLFIGRYVTRFC